MSLTRQQKRAQAAQLKKSGGSPDKIRQALATAIQLHQSGQLDKALELYSKIDNAVQNEPDVKHLTGVVHYQKGDFARAVSFINAAIKMSPGNPAYYNNLGNSYTGLQKFSDAISAYEKAIELKGGNYPEAINNLGAALHETGQWQREIDCYKQALALNPHDYPLMNEAVKSMKDACVWDCLPQYQTRLIEITKIALQQNSLPPVTPYHSLTFDTSPDLKKQIAENYARLKYGHIKPAFNLNRPANDKIRIGYVSADFRDHPTAHLLNGMIKLHNRDEFEVYIYSYGKNDGSDFRKSIEENSDHFIDLENQTADKIAARINKDNIDILFDVMGYIQNARPEIFALRPASIQISFLAYPGSMGAPFIDYLVSDHTAIPTEDEKNYTEKILFMPDTYFVTDNRQPIAKPLSKKEYGLPEDKFIFACFNKSSKIDAAVFSCWMDILKAKPDSILWLLADNDFTRANLAKEAKKRGVSKDRLIFAVRMAKPEHLARHSVADLFLDCFTVNAHTTAIDALYAGLPVITMAGNHIISRASAGILKAIGLEELVTYDIESYRALITDYAANPKKLALLKEKLALNIKSKALFNTEGYVKNMEEGLRGVRTKN